MMTWTQVYTPVGGSILGSALVAAIPVVVLLGLLAFFRVRAHWAALLGLAAALSVAILVYGMPARLALAAAADGAAFGLLPIGWIVFGAIFLYDVTVKSGDFEVVKHTIAGLASDRRIQLLLIGFSFGAFIEGAAGFGTPVAICGAMLIGLGFRPLQAAGLALIGNTAPVAFGALGTPIITLAKVTGLPEAALSAMVGRQLPFFSVLVPFWLIWAMAGRKAMREVWPACLTAGVSFGVTQFLVSNHFGPSLVDIAGSIVSILSLLVLLRFWQPKTIWSFEHESGRGARGRDGGAARAHPEGGASRPWRPGSSSAPSCSSGATRPSKEFLNGGAEGHENFLHGISLVNVPVPGLDKAVVRTPPVVTKPTPEAAVFTFNWLSATGTSLLLTGLLSGLLLGFSLGELAEDPGRDALAGAVVAADHRRHDGPGLHHPLRRPGRDHGARLRDDRRALPLLLAAPRLARGGAHRQRHLVERPLRRPPADQRRTAGLEPHPRLRRQQQRRRDGEDDRRPEHRRGRRRHRPAGERGRDPALRPYL